MLSSAVSDLKGDKITRTLAEQLLYYKDPTVSGFNTLTAQNQLELVFAKKRWHGLLVGFFLFCFLYTGYWGLQYRDQLNYVPKTFSVTTYSIQISSDGRNWSDVTCGAGVACVYESGVLVERPDEIVRNVFPETQMGRFLKIQPWTWSRMEEDDLVDKESRPKQYGEMRLGIIGASDTGSIPYRVVGEGNEGSAWLQKGCNLNMSGISDISSVKTADWPIVAAQGRWASKEESIGKVQCCLTAPRIHVCTRDYCLSGKYLCSGPRVVVGV